MKVFFTYSIVGGLLLLSGCQLYYKEKPQEGFLLPVDLSTISYQMVSQNIFSSRCISCHGNSGGVNLESYSSVKQHLAAIEATALITKTMPKNGSLTPSEAALLSAWIRAGALENPQMPIPEEPLEPTFISIKKKIIDKRCIGCHSVGGKASGVPFTSLKEILDSPREIVLPGNPDESGLIIAVERMDNKKMPPPEIGKSLTQEEIEVLRQWIEIGAPEK